MKSVGTQVYIESLTSIPKRCAQLFSEEAWRFIFNRAQERWALITSASSFATMGIVATGNADVIIACRCCALELLSIATNFTDH
jgi:hypothetical protein